MAEFVGTSQEFNILFSDFVNNKIAAVLEKHKHTKCQLCDEIEATHIAPAHPEEEKRDTLLHEAFQNSIIEQDHQLYRVDLTRFQNCIKKLQTNLDSFHFFCDNCYEYYAQRKLQDLDESRIKPRTAGITLVPENKKNVTFEVYLRTPAFNKANRRYEELTIKAYTEDVPTYLSNHFQINMYRDITADNVKRYIDLVFSNGRFVKDNENGNHIYSAGLERYAEYLEWRSS